MMMPHICQFLADVELRKFRGGAVNFRVGDSPGLSITYYEITRLPISLLRRLFLQFFDLFQVAAAVLCNASEQFFQCELP